MAILPEPLYHVVLRPDAKTEGPSFSIGQFEEHEFHKLAGHLGLLAQGYPSPYSAQPVNIVDAWASEQYICWLLPTSGTPFIYMGGKLTEAPCDPRA